MQRETNTAAILPSQVRAHWQGIVAAISILVVVFLCLYNLTDYPLMWFDEGSHLHVPKTLVRFGVYADYSSEGFRYYGPTVGVGPTVMLPIAALLKLFGIGLLQARLVMAAYLLAAIFVFYRVARQLGSSWFAWVATALLVTSRGVSLLKFGRQLLGEVPGFFFLIAGFSLWFAAWKRVEWWRLGLVGLLLGLAMVTKYQYLLFLAPTLVLAWLVNLLYYRSVPQRVFIVPGLIAAACFALWQAYQLVYLGPATIGENLVMLREAVSGAAMVFSPSRMAGSIKILFDPANYLGGLLPVLIYGFFCALPRKQEGQQWGIVLILVAVNLCWYVVASIGWWRYAFLGLAMSSLFVARFFNDLTDGFQLSGETTGEELRLGLLGLRLSTLRVVLLLWLAAMIALPLGKSVWEIAVPSFNAPKAMATYMNEHVSRDAVVETWEAEMGFLTDHNYHFPPADLLNKAVRYYHFGGPHPLEEYNFVQTASPDYVLVGEFSEAVVLYPRDSLAKRYTLETKIGHYELYKLNR